MKKVRTIRTVPSLYKLIICIFTCDCVLCMRPLVAPNWSTTIVPLWVWWRDNIFNLIVDDFVDKILWLDTLDQTIWSNWKRIIRKYSIYIYLSRFCRYYMDNKFTTLTPPSITPIKGRTYITFLDIFWLIDTTALCLRTTEWFFRKNSSRGTELFKRRNDVKDDQMVRRLGGEWSTDRWQAKLLYRVVQLWMNCD